MKTKLMMTMMAAMILLLAVTANAKTDDYRDMSKELNRICWPFPFPWIPKPWDFPIFTVYDDGGIGGQPVVIGGGSLDTVHIDISIEFDGRHWKIVITINFDKDMTADDEQSNWGSLKTEYR